MTGKISLYPTKTRLSLAAGIKAGEVTDHGWVKGHVTWNGSVVTSRVAEFRSAGLLEPPAPNGEKPPYKVRFNAAGEAWLAGATGMCVRCLTAAATGECCSSHGKKLCHACYRRTHFSEVCVAGCSLCIAEGLPIGTEPITDRGDLVSANIAGFVTGVAWGPAADGTGEWFVRPAEGVAFRVADKAAAVGSLRGLELPVRRLAERGGAS